MRPSGGAYILMNAQTLYVLVYLEINLMSVLLVGFLIFGILTRNPAQ